MIAFSGSIQIERPLNRIDHKKQRHNRKTISAMCPCYATQLDALIKIGGATKLVRAKTKHRKIKFKKKENKIEMKKTKRAKSPHSATNKRLFSSVTCYR